MLSIVGPFPWKKTAEIHHLAVTGIWDCKLYQHLLKCRPNKIDGKKIVKADSKVCPSTVTLFEV